MAASTPKLLFATVYPLLAGTVMWASEDLGTASIDYEPADPSSELDGFVLTLQSESMEDLAEQIRPAEPGEAEEVVSAVMD